MHLRRWKSSCLSQLWRCQYTRANFIAPLDVGRRSESAFSTKDAPSSTQIPIALDEGLWNLKSAHGIRMPNKAMLCKMANTKTNQHWCKLLRSIICGLRYRTRVQQALPQIGSCDLFLGQLSCLAKSEIKTSLTTSPMIFCALSVSARRNTIRFAPSVNTPLKPPAFAWSNMICSIASRSLGS